MIRLMIAAALMAIVSTGCNSARYAKGKEEPAIRVEPPEPAPSVSPAEQSRQYRVAYGEGVRCVEHGRYAEGLAAFEEALRIRPDSTEALFNLGACYDSVGDPLRAISLYRRVIATNPQDPDAYSNLGTSFIKMYYREKSPAWRKMAHEAWKHSLELNPNQPTVRAYMAVKEELDQAVRLMASGQQIIEAILKNPRIPAPSQTVLHVLSMTKKEDCSVASVAQVISKDGALTSQLLRQANSSLYACAQPTSSVTVACTRLGLKRVRSAVLDQHIVSNLGKAVPKSFDPKRHWQAAFATSVAAQELCRELSPVDAEDAGTAGLLCDMGVSLLALGLPVEYPPVLQQFAGQPSDRWHSIEAKSLGVTHAEVGGAVLTLWKIEPQIVKAVELHHAQPTNELPTADQRFPRIIAAACTLASIAMDGSDMERVDMLFSRLNGLTKKVDELVNKLLDRLVANIQKTAESFAVSLGELDQMQANVDAIRGEIPDGASFSWKPMARVTDD